MKRREIVSSLKLFLQRKCWPLKSWVPLCGEQHKEGSSPTEGSSSCVLSHCAQLTLHWLLKQLQLQTKCFTHISWFPLPSTLRPKLLFTASQIIMLWFTKFSLRKPKPTNHCRSGLKKKTNESSSPHPQKCRVKDISLWEKNCAAEDGWGPWAAIWALQSQNTASGKGHFLMDRMAPAAPEGTGDGTWLVWKAQRQVASRSGEAQLVTSYIECVLSMASTEPEKKNLYFLWSKIHIEMPVSRKISYIFFLV